MTNSFRFIVCAAPLLVALSVFASPARADSCDDFASHLAQQIDGLKIGATRGGVIYLEHSAVARATLACSSRTNQGELYAVAPQKKPSPAFLAFVASATAQIFTIPQDDAERGVKRCFGKTGIIRSLDAQTRYRRLDIRCSRIGNNATITISREKDT